MSGEESSSDPQGVRADVSLDIFPVQILALQATVPIDRRSLWQRLLLHAAACSRHPNRRDRFRLIYWLDLPGHPLEGTLHRRKSATRHQDLCLLGHYLCS